MSTPIKARSYQSWLHLFSGLVSLEEMRAKQEDVVKARERQIATNIEEEAESSEGKKKSKKPKKHKMKKVIVNCHFTFIDRNS